MFTENGVVPAARFHRQTVVLPSEEISHRNNRENNYCSILPHYPGTGINNTVFSEEMTPNKPGQAQGNPEKSDYTPCVDRSVKKNAISFSNTIGLFYLSYLFFWHCE
jgi:hypothetical protein